MTDEEESGLWEFARNMVDCDKKMNALEIYEKLALHDSFGSHVAAAAILEELMPDNWRQSAYRLLRGGCRTSDPEAMLMLGRLVLSGDLCSVGISSCRARWMIESVVLCSESNCIKAIAEYTLGTFLLNNSDENAAKIHFERSAKFGSVHALYALAGIHAGRNNYIRERIYAIRAALTSLRVAKRPASRWRLMVK